MIYHKTIFAEGHITFLTNSFGSFLLLFFSTTNAPLSGFFLNRQTQGSRFKKFPFCRKRSSLWCWLTCVLHAFWFKLFSKRYQKRKEWNSIFFSPHIICCNYSLEEFLSYLATTHNNPVSVHRNSHCPSCSLVPMVGTFFRLLMPPKRHGLSFLTGF